MYQSASYRDDEQKRGRTSMSGSDLITRTSVVRGDLRDGRRTDILRVLTIAVEVAFLQAAVLER